MTATKQKSKIGDKAWEVEWVSLMAFYEDGSVDHDGCTTSFRHFKTEKGALDYANKIWPTTKEKMGHVSVTPIRFVPYDEDDAIRYPNVGFWEPCGNTLHVVDDTGVPEE